MLTWIPASLVFYQRYCHATCCCCLRSAEAANPNSITDADSVDGMEHLEACQIGRIICKFRAKSIRSTRVFFDSILPGVIVKPRLLWLITLGGLFLLSIVAIFYSPGLKLPDTEQFQLFTHNHIFER